MKRELTASANISLHLSDKELEETVAGLKSVTDTDDAHAMAIHEMPETATNEQEFGDACMECLCAANHQACMNICNE